MSLPRGIVQRLAGGLISICLIACPVLAQSLEVIDLKYRTAAEVIPVLQPPMEQGGALSGQDYKLFVRTSPANLQQLRAALAQIDRQPNQLLVSVRRSTQQQIELERAQVSGTVSNRGANVAVRATDSTQRDRSDGVAEGFRAWVNRNRQAAFAWIEKTERQPWNEPALAVYATTIAGERPKEAIELAQRITEPELREYTMSVIGKAWFKQDRAAAEAWLAQPGVSERVRQSSKMVAGERKRPERNAPTDGSAIAPEPAMAP